jgi:TetR/AcrR family transcriptional repressor of nem operon
MSRQDTRQTILQNGAKIIHSKGFVNTGIKDILEASGVPKGSFYFYFKSKEDFGQALVDYYYTLISSIFEKHLHDRNLPPIDRFKGLIDNYCKIFKNLQFTSGCPIGNLSQEMSDLSEPIREKLQEAYSKMRSSIRDCLIEAKELGQIDARWNIDDLAVFVLNSWEGALMDMKLSKSIQPLMAFKNIIFNFIVKDTSASG